MHLTLHAWQRRHRVRKLCDRGPRAELEAGGAGQGARLRIHVRTRVRAAGCGSRQEVPGGGLGPPGRHGAGAAHTCRLGGGASAAGCKMGHGGMHAQV